MAAFDYIALDDRGREQKGVLEADSSRQIRQLLRDRGWAPIKVDPAAEKSRQQRSGFFAPRLGALDLSLVTRQFATLVQAGLPLEEALSAVAQQSEKARIRSIMMGVRGRVLEGFPLAEALGEFPAAFDHMYRATVAAGEKSGHLDLVLNNLADYTERQHRLSQNVSTALIYPFLLMAFSIGIVTYLLVAVVPQILDVFDKTDQQLPLATTVLIAVSNFLQSSGLWVLLVLIAAVVTLRYLLRQPLLRAQVDQLVLSLPFVGRFFRAINASRFASTLSILSASGVPLVDGMRIAGAVVPNTSTRARVEAATQLVSEGSSLFRALDQVGSFPPMMLHMIASGESSGELEQMLARVATHQEAELERTVTVFVKLLEPIMVGVMGLMVLFIVIAIMLPIMQLNQGAQL